MGVITVLYHRVLLELPYLGLDLGYLLGLILLCLKNIPCFPEKLCFGELLNWNSRSRVILITCSPLWYRWCCIQQIYGIHLGNEALLILPRICCPKLFLLLGTYHLLCFAGKVFSLPILYSSQCWKLLMSTSPITWA